MALDTENSKAIQQDRALTPQTAGAAASGSPLAGKAPWQQAAPSGETRRWPVVPIVLTINTVLVLFVTGMVIATMTRSTRQPPAPNQIIFQMPNADHSQQSASSAPATIEATGDCPPWERVERSYADGKYDLAIVGYNQLLAAAQGGAAQPVIIDFLKYRVGCCLSMLAQAQAATDEWSQAATGVSPAVQAAAEYQLARQAALDAQPMLARMRAYQALCAIGAMSHPPANLQADCDFLIAWSMTSKAQSLFPDAPALDRSGISNSDIFAGVAQPQLGKLLTDGAESNAAALLGPQIQRTDTDRWTVTANRTSVEDLLSHLATQPGIEVEWSGVDATARARTISLVCRDVSAQRLAELACGSADLIARHGGTGLVVHDPKNSITATQQRQLLVREADFAWRGYFLRYNTDKRNPDGRFILAGLYEASDDIAAALREYQLTADQFPRSDKAPRALLQTTRLRMAKLRDYAGAKEGLEDLLDRYPDFQLSHEVYLNLGKAAMEMGLMDEAIQRFNHINTAEAPAEARCQAYLNIGRCLNAKGEHTQATIWLTKYVTQVQGAPQRDIADAYVLIALSQLAIGSSAESCSAYRLALAANPPASAIPGIMLELAAAEVQHQELTDALGVLGKIDMSELSPQGKTQHALLTAQVYRTMGLLAKARLHLTAALDDTTDEPSRLTLTVDLARCQVQLGELAAARKMLTDVLPKLPPGPVAQAVSCDLADICLKTDQVAQAIALCRELVKPTCDAQIRRRAGEILHLAYLAQQEYELAAIALANASAVPKEK